MQQEDIRWKQRFENYKRALDRLAEGVALSQQRPLSQLEKQGLIQGFEFTFELGWNVLRDFLRDRGIERIIGSRDAIREAFSAGLIEDGEAWMEMLKDRNLVSHTYNEDVAETISAHILDRYFKQFEKLRSDMQEWAAQP
ncbi:MAG: nucleotidyltransferase [Nitrosomonadales bacterium]|nr:MAG: nucleotidyltransferase [Nitrosomonadales bacterium]